MTVPGEMRAIADHPPQLRHRVFCAVAAGLLFGMLCHALLLAWGFDVQANDFTYPWLGARALLQGHNPYVAVSSERTPWGLGLFYPLPAVLIAAPVAWLPAHAAGVVFMTVSFAFLALVLTRRGMWRLLVLASAPAFQACISVQWSPLLTAAALFPPALGIVVAKPNFALPLLAFQSRRTAWYFAAIGAAALLILSFAAMPAWPTEWLHILRSNRAVGRYAIPLGTRLGCVVVLAVFRWRRPEARLLLFMACVPQLGFFYDQLVLLLVATARVELLMSVMASDIAYTLALLADNAHVGVGVSNVVGFPYMIGGVYLPALFMVLRRPNVGSVPVWLERVAKRFPAWIGGSAAEQA